jgi:hypothetical protein
MQGPSKQNPSAQEKQLADIAAVNALEADKIRGKVENQYLASATRDKSDALSRLNNANSAVELSNSLSQVNPNNEFAVSDAVGAGVSSLSTSNLAANIRGSANQTEQTMNALRMGKGQQLTAQQGVTALARIQNNEMSQKMQRDQLKRMDKLNALASVGSAGYSAYSNNSGIFRNGYLDQNGNLVEGSKGWLHQYGSGDNSIDTSLHDYYKKLNPDG